MSEFMGYYKIIYRDKRNVLAKDESGYFYLGKITKTNKFVPTAKINGHFYKNEPLIENIAKNISSYQKIVDRAEKQKKAYLRNLIRSSKAIPEIWVSENSGEFSIRNSISQEIHSIALDGNTRKLLGLSPYTPNSGPFI